jgi:enoyl-CoA hydratase
MGAPAILIEKKDRVAIMTLDSPPVNALSAAMYRQLLAHLDDVEHDESVHVMILTGAGERAFCAGADTRELARLDSTTRIERYELVQSAFARYSSFALPTVCAVNGPAPGGGSVLASLSDYRVASDRATLSYPEIDRGTAAGGGVFLRRAGVAPGAMRELLYSGRTIDAHEARELHLVDVVVPHAQLMERAMEIAQRFAVKDRQALVSMKQAILMVEREPDWLRAYESTHGISAAMTAARNARAGMDK